MLSRVERVSREDYSTFQPKSAENMKNEGILVTGSFQAINFYNQSHIFFDLYMAVISGNAQNVRNILLSHPDADFNILVKGATVLSLSLYKRHFDIFNLLMRHSERRGKTCLNTVSKDELNRREPPLITACRMHFTEGVISLVNAGADIDAQDNFGHTALWVAARQQMPDLVEYLIVNGASVNITDRYNYTPLITAMMYKVTSHITKALVLNGSNLDGPRVVSSYQNSPLFWASKYKDFEMMRLILLAGVPMWLIRCVKHSLHDATGRNAAAIGYLDDFTRNAPSLKQICRRILRTAVSESCKGKYFGQNIETLPLPQILKCYLLLKVEN